jgi:hypothetical protein
MLDQLRSVIGLLSLDVLVLRLVHFQRAHFLGIEVWATV